MYVNGAEGEPKVDIILESSRYENTIETCLSFTFNIFVSMTTLDNLVLLLT